VSHQETVFNGFDDIDHRVMVMVLGSGLWWLVVAAATIALGPGSGSSSTAPTSTTVPAGPSNEEAVALGKKELGTCAGCHGVDATGVTGLGKNLVDSEFIAGISDADLAAFIKKGRPISDPANTTGIDMPPKGGRSTTRRSMVWSLTYVRFSSRLTRRRLGLESAF